MGIVGLGLSTVTVEGLNGAHLSDVRSWHHPAHPAQIRNQLGMCLIVDVAQGREEESSHNA